MLKEFKVSKNILCKIKCREKIKSIRIIVNVPGIPRFISSLIPFLLYKENY